MERFNFDGKIVLVTGASRGIGKSIAFAFGEAGANVAVAARKTDLLKEVVKEIQGRGGDGFYVKCDLVNDKDIFNLIEKTVERYGRIDILVNNAGISPFVKRSEEVTKEMFEEVLEHEILVTSLINNLVALTMEEKDYTTHNFLQWFVTEQIEEESLMRGILDKFNLAEGAKGGLFHLDKELEGLAAAEAAAEGE